MRSERPDDLRTPLNGEQNDVVLFNDSADKKEVTAHKLANLNGYFL